MVVVEVLETGPGSTRGRGRLVTALGWLLAGALVVGGTFLVVELRAGRLVAIAETAPASKPAADEAVSELFDDLLEVSSPQYIAANAQVGAACEQQGAHRHKNPDANPQQIVPTANAKQNEALCRERQRERLAA